MAGQLRVRLRCKCGSMYLLLLLLPVLLVGCGLAAPLQPKFIQNPVDGYEDCGQCVQHSTNDVLHEVLYDVESKSDDEVADIACPVLEHFTEHSTIRFFEIENRDFEVLHPIVLDGEYFYKVVAMGRLNDGSMYHIDSFAVSLENNRIYVWHDKTNQFARSFGSRMLYRSNTSPNGNYRIEFADVGGGSLGSQGQLGGGFLRIVELEAGYIKWRSEEILCNRIGNIAWSLNSRFVAFDLPWINDTDAIVIDTFCFTHFHLLGLSSVIDAISYAVGSEIRHSPYNEFHHSIVRWVDASTLEIRFYCLTVDGRVIEGTYQYNVKTNKVKIVTILE